MQLILTSVLLPLKFAVTAWLFIKSLLNSTPRQPPPKHVLITGAGSGIGAGLADRYAAPGVLLSLCDRNAAGLETTKDACVAKGATVFTKVC